MAELWIAPAIAGLVGLAVGSFLNVCVYRWPRDLSVVSPSSRCPGCGEGILWRDNVPVVSYLLLRGRCRHCGEPISVQYPVVELTTGLVWAGMFALHGGSLEALRGSLFLTILFGVALTDYRHYLIPDEFSLGGLALGLVLSALPGGTTILQALLGAAVGFLLLWGVAWMGQAMFKKQAMGGGDIKMMAMVGSFVGLAGVLLTLFIGALLGTLVFGPISLKTKKLVPFGIFLALGAAVVYGWGDHLLGWYFTAILGLPAP